MIYALEKTKPQREYPQHHLNVSLPRMFRGMKPVPLCPADKSAHSGNQPRLMIAEDNCAPSTAPSITATTFSPFA
uniref:Transposase n=1 Tax=Steinernema glaseri TaxID=37863 RepID=A0A1I7YFZ5_9BILA